MSTPSPQPSIESALTDLVVNCPELTQLETRLARFNLFRVLKADRHELRHSNLLAWLLQPDESHGLGDSFLRHWLIRVLHDASAKSSLPAGWISPIEIDTLAFDYVEVHRELANIDVLVEIHRPHGGPWIIAIENKVESVQHGTQLARYRETVDRLYGHAARRVYLFLTKYGDDPHNEAYIPTTYAEVAETLSACVAEMPSALRSLSGCSS